MGVRNTFVTLGDSRMGRDGGVTVASPGETSIYKTDRGIVSWAMVQLRQRLEWVAQGGVGGNTVAQMRARIDSLLSFNPGYLIGFGHVNSTTVASANSIIADLDYIFNKCLEKGVKVVWGTDWPGSSNAAPARLISYTVNNWLRSQVGARKDFYLVDYQAVFVDPVTGDPSATDAADGLHQDSIGAAKLGNQLFNVLNTLIPKSDRLIASNDDPINLLINGMVAGGTTYATSWTSNGTAGQGVASKVARTDGYPGEWQQVVVTGGTDYALRQRTVVADNKWVVGDTVYAECEFETDAAGWAATEFNLNVIIYGSFPAGTLLRSSDMIHINATPNSSSRLASGVFRTPPILLPSGITTVDVTVQLKGSGTYRIARAALKRA